MLEVYSWQSLPNFSDGRVSTVVPESVWMLSHSFLCFSCVTWYISSSLLINSWALSTQDLSHPSILFMSQVHQAGGVDFLDWFWLIDWFPVWLHWLEIEQEMHGLKGYILCGFPAWVSLPFLHTAQLQWTCPWHCCGAWSIVKLSTKSYTAGRSVVVRCPSWPKPSLASGQWHWEQWKLLSF